MKKSKYYSLENILKTECDYNIIFGERSNGKTYASLEYALKKYVNHGEQSAYIRRWTEDLKGKRCDTLFAGLISNGVVEKLTKHKYNDIIFFQNKWFLCRTDPKTKKKDPDLKPFCYAFSLSNVEHDKSTSYPEITTIIFDEFITRKYYLTDEFIIFMNVLSTIIRDRGNVKIFMLGNTVNQFCPYFAELGLKNVLKMSQGNIDVYTFGSGVRIAVEYTSPNDTPKESNKYFSFDNPQLNMITGGKWELAVYPHLPRKYTPKEVAFNYYIDFNGVLLHGEIIMGDNDTFTYIHRKTTPLDDNTLTYSLTPTENPLRKRRLINGNSRMERKIAMYFVTDKVFYQDNEVGEVVRNYIIESTKNNVMKL